MTAVTVSLFFTVLLFASVLADPKTITAESGQTVTLPCQAPNNNLMVVDWSRTDLDPEYIYLYRDGHFDLDNQHPLFKNRVELQDKEMKDGDVSVIVKAVTTDDSGTYECRIKQKIRTVLDSAPISIIYLRVSDPPGGGSAGLDHLSLSALLLIVALVAF